MNSIQDVIKAELCISCGACVSMAPEGTMEMRLHHDKGIYLPEILDKDRVKGNGIEFAVCPGQGIPIERLSSSLYEEIIDSTVEFGRYRYFIAAYTNDENIRRRASSGGVMTDIAFYLLEKKVVDGVVAVKFMYTSYGPRTQPYIARSIEDLLAAQGSKYCPTSTNVLMKECQKQGGRYLFIGTPCQVAALRLASEVDKSLALTFPYTMANFCGGYRDFRYADGMLRYSGVEPSEVISFRFRGGGWPGSMKAVTRSNQIVYQDYPNFESNALVNKQKRCTLCVDGTGLLADFACGDAWIDRLRNEKNGWSIILARSQSAQDIIEKMIGEKRLNTYPISYADLLYSQRYNLYSKISRQKKRMVVFRFLGITCPKFDLNLPDGNNTYYQEFLIIFNKLKVVMFIQFGWKLTFFGKKIVRFAKELLNRE